MNITPLLAATAFVALSGCAGLGSESTLKYDGAANGAHSDTVQCDDEGRIKGSGNVPDGAVLVTLADADGKQLFQQTFKGGFMLPEETVSGASGSWSFDARRSGDDLVGDSFSGDYAFYVNC
jgi:hypothetical protein